MRLYTGTGDDGTTALFGGQRVAKDHPRVAAYGTVDELNACIGLAAAACDRARPVHGQFLEVFAVLQSRLFDLGADLATPQGQKQEQHIARISDNHVREAEGWIDAIEAGNAPMKRFVLPGGTELAARLHLARTVCRRAERLMVALNRDEPINPAAIVYLNRVSDLFFAMARRANADAGVADVPWVAAQRGP